MMLIQPLCCGDHIWPLRQSHAQCAVGHWRIAMIADVHRHNRYVQVVKRSIKIQRANVLGDTIGAGPMHKNEISDGLRCRYPPALKH